MLPLVERVNAGLAQAPVKLANPMAEEATGQEEAEQIDPNDPLSMLKQRIKELKEKAKELEEQIKAVEDSGLGEEQKSAQLDALRQQLLEVQGALMDAYNQLAEQSRKHGGGSVGSLIATLA
ncbi:hypothetical protein [Gallaecimonas xiamenensis]|uniref:Uncharacterized protein n=1 Tax=Gallaecimonas xiamenensis 3-C-1 TaxID=745411 RepID=K2JR95_9GAMM|nr:hypothetical protein [Gallaecimonas xiamenensis]EKE77893.1 hypothetical protein B3C1_00495 [Gallaecimonas xiamenensis 3-C-1]